MKKSNSFRTAFFTMLIAASFISLFSSCEKDTHKPPTVTLTSTAGYTSADATVAKGAVIKVGVTVDKVEDDLNTYNISRAYDGASTNTSYYTYSMNSSEYTHYAKDTTFTTRNVAGTEKWFFTITDHDGNQTQKTITLTVQ